MLLLPLLALAVAAPEPVLEEILARVAEEAEVFARVAPQTLAEETLRQKAAKNTPRFRVRVGDAARARPPVQFQTREIVSEYGFSAFKESPGNLHEFRRVISVDGRPVQSVEKARATLTMGITSEDDRVKKRMLQEFERYGLVGAAMDFGQVILLFGRRGLGNYSFQIKERSYAGADRAVVVAFAQREGEQALTIFEGRRALRLRLEGEIWVRDPDWRPLRIVLRTAHEDRERKIRNEAAIDYVMSAHGVLLPASVVHRQFSGDELSAENLFRYSPFRKFTAEAEIKFEVQEEPPKTPK